MTSTEKLVLTTTAKRVNYYLEQDFGIYVILEYIDGIITLSRNKYSDELLRALFDLRQKFLLGKEIEE